MKRIRDILSRLRTKLFGSVIQAILSVLSWLAVALIFFAMTIYLINYIQGKAEAPLGLSIVSATIGGLLLSGSFLEVPPVLKKVGRRIGTLYLVAALSLVLLGLFYPAFSEVAKLQTQGLVYYLLLGAVLFSWGVGGISFASATGWLIRTLPEFWR